MAMTDCLGCATIDLRVSQRLCTIYFLLLSFLSLLCTGLFSPSAWAWAKHDVSAGVAPFFGTISADGEVRNFRSATGVAANYSFYLSPDFAVESGYEAGLVESDLAIHGPDFGATYILYGARPFSFSEEPLYLKVTQPLSISVTAGSWYRFYNLKNFFPPEVRTLEQFEELVKPGGALGMSASLNFRLQMADAICAFVRARYATGRASEIRNGTFTVLSAQFGTIFAL
jgi:hypothetical protein